MEILLLKEQIIEIKKSWSLAFKNNAPFISYISKINGVLMENTEDLDIVMQKLQQKLFKDIWFFVEFS